MHYMGSTFLTKVHKERLRQIIEEGHTPDMDDTSNANDQLALAAACYAMPGSGEADIFDPPTLWPWWNGTWKPTPHDRQRELVKAAALLNAEYDRLERLKNSKDIS